jgi:predicted small lipoprotein YifL
MMTPQKRRFLVAAALTGTVLTAAALGLSACGKMGPLESAPPMYNDKAKAKWDQNHSGDSISSQNLPGGGNEATLAPTSSTSKETEKALPDANGPNTMPNPYTQIGPNSPPLDGSSETHPVSGY